MMQRNLSKSFKSYLSFKTWFLILTVVLYSVYPESASPQQLQGPWSGHFDFEQTTPPISEAQQEEIRRMLKSNIARLKELGIQAKVQDAAPVSLHWPLRSAPGLNEPGYHGVSGFVDHNPNYPNQVEDYNCGDRSYDLDSGYNHKGTDYFLWPFAWHKVNADEVWVVAAAPGIIIGRRDGNTDRNCGFGGGTWNAVYVQHADGSIVYYGHLKKDSVTAKQVGDTVSTGDYLGVVASSGNSTGPHLHFQLQDENFNIIDPYAGSCNFISSRWADQRSYYRDQLAGQESRYTVFKPDGSIYYQWTHASDATHYAASYWYWYMDFPVDAPRGVWHFQVHYEGLTYSHRFIIGHIQNPAPTLLLLSLVPES